MHTRLNGNYICTFSQTKESFTHHVPSAHVKNGISTWLLCMLDSIESLQGIAELRSDIKVSKLTATASDSKKSNAINSIRTVGWCVHVRVFTLKFSSFSFVIWTCIWYTHASMHAYTKILYKMHWCIANWFLVFDKIDNKLFIHGPSHTRAQIRACIIWWWIHACCWGCCNEQLQATMLHSIELKRFTSVSVKIII